MQDSSTSATEDTRPSTAGACATTKTSSMAIKAINSNPTSKNACAWDEIGCTYETHVKMPIFGDPILSSPPPKPPNMSMSPSYQPQGFENKPVDMDAIETELQTAFKENAPQHENIISVFYESPRKEYW